MAKVAGEGGSTATAGSYPAGTNTGVISFERLWGWAMAMKYIGQADTHI